MHLLTPLTLLLSYCYSFICIESMASQLLHQVIQFFPTFLKAAPLFNNKLNFKEDTHIFKKASFVSD